MERSGGEPAVTFVFAVLCVVLLPAVVYAWGSLTVEKGCFATTPLHPNLAAVLVLVGLTAAGFGVYGWRRELSVPMLAFQVLCVLLGAGFLCFFALVAVAGGAGCFE